MTTAHDNYLHYLAIRNDIYEEGEYEAIISAEITTLIKDGAVL